MSQIGLIRMTDGAVECVPDLRGQLASLHEGIIPLDRFLAWYWANADAIEFDGSDANVDLLNAVSGLLDEYISDYIDASELLAGVMTDSLVLQEVRGRRAAVA